MSITFIYILFARETILRCLAVQNDRYLILTAQLYDAKDMAATAKTKADKTGQRMAQDRIRIIQQGEQQSRHSFLLHRLGT